MITYDTNKKVDYNRLITLFKEVGWNDKTDDLERLKTMVDNSQVVITAWDDELMVGFARCTTDYVFNGQINNVVVACDYRGRGIGKNLVEKIVKNNDKVTYILRGDTDNLAFYNNLGFKSANTSLVYSRKG